MTYRANPKGRALILAPIVLALACTGQVGGSSGQPPGGTVGGSGSVGTGGSGSGLGGTSSPQAAGPRDPGRVTMRRLNRVEYDNTVRDLLGTTQTPARDKFINDAPQLGFDNDGAQQTLAPVQFTLYQQAAEALAAEVMTTPAQRQKVVTCELTSGASCAQTAISSFGLRAFRRPLAADEVAAYVSLMATAAQAGVTPDEQFQTVLEAMLVSPHFLFRPELDADPTSLTPHPLTPYETASRLSYTIVRSMPDQALFDVAAAGKLAEPADVRAQAKRLLASANNAFAGTFSAQWLGTVGLPLQTFDASAFPAFSPALATSMASEVTSFFNEFVEQNRPVSQLLTADFSYLDQGLAGLYGIAAPAGSGLVRTTLGTPQRGGLLTMAGVLAVTSYPTRTSLVKRGAWVLSQMLCAQTPAPPADVPPFPEGKVTATTQIEILRQHRANPACAACHDSMDNIGSAMENYNAIGAYQTSEAGATIDASGKFAGAIAEPDGKDGPSFNGARELSAAVAADPRFASCAAQKMLAYSLGRAVLPSDRPYLDDITQPSANGTLGAQDLIMNIAASDTFRMRHGESVTPGVMP